MKALSGLLLIFVATAAHAGVIHGTITAPDNPLANAPVSIVCDDVEPFTGNTNERGRYSINVQRQGKCTLRVTYRQESLEHQVFSYPDPTQYDFEIVRDEGSWTLRRK